ncbi:ATP synthase subunit delta [Candidatus Protochlamydia naegleriophila]|uniref:ATP synthase subunit delta n=1 Tax=Candidatus Protochlamydia naegleriophila TaxID=389348 RepID=A0A0U5JDS2_9BACT|nr:ATP synthase F1 subunit delta [Candidatus Protochlamydia naegleriophila]CUI17261.1 ATP synthase subunit delta [Candidatus Protochlamydia naegleriophila]
MIAKAVASRYSKALVDAATSPEQLEKHLAALEEIADLLQAMPKLREFLFDPHLSTRNKKNILQRLFGERLDKTILSFLYLLIEKGRFKYLSEIRKEYHRLVKQKLGIIEARLITAVPAEDALKEKVKDKLEKAYRKTIDIKSEVRPDIIGGMILIVGHKMIDDSVKQRLAKLKDSLLAAKV